MTRAKLVRSTVCAAICVLGVGTASATLIDQGGGLIYDSDLNITWYDYIWPTQGGGGGSWGDANTWASGLTVSGVSGWRLPTSDTCQGYNCTSSEMGHLYYTELGNMVDPSGFGPASWGPFVNLIGSYYWSSTESNHKEAWEDPTNLFPTWALRFEFGAGSQNIQYKSDLIYAMAVHDGNVAAPIPEPASLALLGLGLAGLGFSRRRKA